MTLDFVRGMLVGAAVVISTPSWSFGRQIELIVVLCLLFTIMEEE